MTSSLALFSYVWGVKNEGGFWSTNETDRWWVIWGFFLGLSFSLFDVFAVSLLDVDDDDVVVSVGNDAWLISFKSGLSFDDDSELLPDVRIRHQILKNIL